MWSSFSTRILMQLGTFSTTSTVILQAPASEREKKGGREGGRGGERRTCGLPQAAESDPCVPVRSSTCFLLRTHRLFSSSRRRALAWIAPNTQRQAAKAAQAHSTLYPLTGTADSAASTDSYRPALTSPVATLKRTFSIVRVALALDAGDLLMNPEVRP